MTRCSLFCPTPMSHFLPRICSDVPSIFAILVSCLLNVV